VKQKNATVAFEVDEHRARRPRAEILAKLAPVFKKDGVVTAGNASGICDGAAALVLTTEGSRSKRPRAPARLIGGRRRRRPANQWASGLPRHSSRAARTDLKLSISIWSRSTKRSPRNTSRSKKAGPRSRKDQRHGGAIALGHPLGASGARITTHLVYELARRKAALPRKRVLSAAARHGRDIERLGRLD